LKASISLRIVFRTSEKIIVRTETEGNFVGEIQEEAFTRSNRGPERARGIAEEDRRWINQGSNNRRTAVSLCERNPEICAASGDILHSLSVRCYAVEVLERL
jgi:hypothetical protein